MSEDYYKARIGELERELEAAHAELGQYGADIKMLEKRLEAANAENVRLSGKSGCCIECERLARELDQSLQDQEYYKAELGAYAQQISMMENNDDEQKLWELYLKFLDKYADDDVLSTAQEALKVWKERK